MTAWHFPYSILTTPSCVNDLGRSPRFHSVGRCLLLVFLVSGHSIDAFYNSAKPPNNENYDPRQANPRCEIRCEGPLPPFSLPLFLDWDPNDPNVSSLQKICAKPQYFGQPPGPFGLRGLQLWCRPHDDSDPRGLRVFREVVDDHTADKPSSPLWHPRLLLYCVNRCWCNQRHYASIWNREFLPETIPRLSNAPSKRSYLLSIDIQDDYLDPLPHLGLLGDRFVPVLVIKASEQVKWQQGKEEIFKAVHVSLDPHNEIVCDDQTVPRNLVLPSPGTHDNFTSLLELCANTLSGGWAGVNAGGYCHRYIATHSATPGQAGEEVDDEVLADVYFADELSPRLEWTSSVFGQFRTLNRVRMYCWEHCRCKHFPEPKQRPGPRYMFDLQNNPRLSQYLPVIPHAAYAVSPVIGGRTLVLPCISIFGFTPGGFQQCSPGDRSCHSEGCRVVMAPAGPLVSSQNSRLESDRGIFCGANCEGPARRSCPGALGDQECRCTVPSAPVAAVLGLDSTVSQAFCLSLVLTKTFVQQKFAESGNLLGRRADVLDPFDWQCPCNGTYASTACCESESGFI